MPAFVRSVISLSTARASRFTRFILNWYIKYRYRPRRHTFNGVLCILLMHQHTARHTVIINVEKLIPKLAHKPHYPLLRGMLMRRYWNFSLWFHFKQKFTSVALSLDGKIQTPLINSLFLCFFLLSPSLYFHSQTRLSQDKKDLYHPCLSSYCIFQYQWNVCLCFFCVVLQQECQVCY